MVVGFAELDCEDQRALLVRLRAKIYVWQDAGRVKGARAAARMDRLEWDFEGILGGESGEIETDARN